MLHEISPWSPRELKGMLAAYPFHPVVFVLPPWREIYANDAERDQSFAEAVDVHTRVVRWYRSCGYTLEEVPRLAAGQRAEHILHVLET